MSIIGIEGNVKLFSGNLLSELRNSRCWPYPNSNLVIWNICQNHIFWEAEHELVLFVRARCQAPCHQFHLFNFFKHDGHQQKFKLLELLPFGANISILIGLFVPRQSTPDLLCQALLNTIKKYVIFSLFTGLMIKVQSFVFHQSNLSIVMFRCGSIKFPKSLCCSTRTVADAVKVDVMHSDEILEVSL